MCCTECTKIYFFFLLGKGSFCLYRHYSNKNDIKKLLAAYPGGNVELHKDDTKGTAKILINNPDKKNAFSGKCKNFSVVSLGNNRLIVLKEACLDYQAI